MSIIVLFELIFGFIIFSKTRGVFLIRHLTYITPFKGGIDSSITIYSKKRNNLFRAPLFWKNTIIILEI